MGLNHAVLSVKNENLIAAAVFFQTVLRACSALWSLKLHKTWHVTDKPQEQESFTTISKKYRQRLLLLEIESDCALVTRKWLVVESCSLRILTKNKSFTKLIDCVGVNWIFGTCLHTLVYQTQVLYVWENLQEKKRWRQKGKKWGKWQNIDAAWLSPCPAGPPHLRVRERPRWVVDSPSEAARLAFFKFIKTFHINLNFVQMS